MFVLVGGGWVRQVRVDHRRGLGAVRVSWGMVLGWPADGIKEKERGRTLTASSILSASMPCLLVLPSFWALESKGEGGALRRVKGDRSTVVEE